MKAKRVHLTKQLPADLVAEVNSGRLMQVISNLANAIEAYPKQGSLSVNFEDSFTYRFVPK